MSEDSGRVVLITGASSGIGEAAGLACAKAGFRVALAARRLDRLRELEARIARPGETLVVESDVRDLESGRRMVAETEAAFGRIDALVANAGIGFSGEFAEQPAEQIEATVATNLLGVMRCARAVLPAMLERGSGHVLVVSSVAADVPSADSVVYGASKGGVKAFAEALYREVRPRGVYVSDIAPGFIRTEMTRNVPIPMPPASVVGNLIVSLLRRPRRRAVVPRYYGAIIWANRFAPRLVDFAIRRGEAEFERRRGG